MKKYRLLKDLPTFKAGSLFELDDDGSLYYTNKSYKHNLEAAASESRIMAYHARTLKKFPNILEDWFEELDHGERRAKSATRARNERIKELLGEFYEKWFAEFSGVLEVSAVISVDDEHYNGVGNFGVSNDIVSGTEEDLLGMLVNLNKIIEENKADLESFLSDGASEE